jgi:hypothetical protein
MLDKTNMTGVFISGGGDHQGCEDIVKGNICNSRREASGEANTLTLAFQSPEL